MKKEQEGEVVIGRKKIVSIAYADDIVLMATTLEELRGVLKRFGKYIEKKGVELNVEKSKIMVIRKARGRKTRYKFTWKGKKIKEVKEFDYLGYRIRQDNKDISQIEKLVRKAKGLIRKIWGIGEKNFKDDWGRRMRLFDTFIGSVMMYGSEI